MGVNGKVSGHGTLAVAFRHQRELTGKSQPQTGHTEQRTKHVLQNQRTRRLHEPLERAGMGDRPAVSPVCMVAA